MPTLQPACFHSATPHAQVLRSWSHPTSRILLDFSAFGLPGLNPLGIPELPNFWARSNAAAAGGLPGDEQLDARATVMAAAVVAAEKVFGKVRAGSVLAGRVLQELRGNHNFRNVPSGSGESGGCCYCQGRGGGGWGGRVDDGPVYLPLLCRESGTSVHTLSALTVE